MKIVHVAPSAPYNDNWGYQDNLLPRYHQKAGHETVVVTTNLTHREGKIVPVPCGEYVLEDGVRVIRLARKDYGHRVLTSLNSRLEVYDLLTRLRPDFIFFHGLVSSSIRDVARYKRKCAPNCVVVCDNHMDWYNGRTGNSLKERFIRGFYRWVNRPALKYIDRVYAVTPWRLAYAEDYFGVPASMTEVLVMGADDEKIPFQKQAEIRAAFRMLHGIGEEDFLVVTGGKLDRAKQAHLLMQAVAELDMPQLKLAVFGTPDEQGKQALEPWENHTSIRMIGWVPSDEVYRVFLSADLCAFPGTHSVLWEQAVACRVPCVFKHWEGMHHVDVGGNCAFLYEDSAEEIKRILTQITENGDYLRAMKQAACSDRAGQFLYSRIARKTVEFAMSATGGEKEVPHDAV